MKRLALILGTACLLPAAMASEPLTPAACATRAAETLQVPREVIAAVWAHENGRVGRCSPPNANGSVDCGPMQVNSIQIADYARVGVTLEALRDEPCVNFAVAADLLRRHYRATGSWYAAMGRYHSKNPAPAAVYLRRIDAVLVRLRNLGAE